MDVKGSSLLGKRINGRSIHCGRPCVGSRWSLLQDKYIHSVYWKAQVRVQPSSAPSHPTHLMEVRVLESESEQSQNQDGGVLGPSPEITETRWSTEAAPLPTQCTPGYLVKHPFMQSPHVGWILFRDLPGGPGAKTPCSQCRGPGFNP